MNSVIEFPIHKRGAFVDELTGLVSRAVKEYVVMADGMAWATYDTREDALDFAERVSRKVDFNFDIVEIN